MYSRLRLQGLGSWIFIFVTLCFTSVCRARCRRSPEAAVQLFEINGCSSKYISKSDEVTQFDVYTATPTKLEHYKDTHYRLKLESKLRLNELVRRHSVNCETVFLQVECSGPRKGNDVLKSESFINYSRSNQNLHLDRFVFFGTDLCLEETVESIVSTFRWTKMLNFVYFATISRSAMSYKSSILTPALPPYGYWGALVREHLHGHTILVTSLWIPPYVDVRDGKPVGGFFYELLVAAAGFYNFSYRLEVPVFKGVRQLPNGTFTGPFGQVVDGERDVVLGSAQSYERDVYLDFTVYVDMIELKFVSSQPVGRVESEAILFIFQPIVWLFLLLSLFITIFTFYLSLRPMKQLSYETKVFYAVEVALCPLLDKGFSTTHNLPSLSLLLPWMLMCIVIGTYYRSDFIAYLSLPTSVSLPASFRQLSQRQDYAIRFLERGTADSYFFNHSTSEVFSKIRQRFKRVNTGHKCLSAASFETGTVCIMWDQAAELGLASNLTLQRQLPRYKFSSESALSLPSCMGLTRGSRYTESLSAIAGYVRAAGLISKWKADSYDLGLLEGKAWMRTEGGSDTYQKLKVLMDAQLGSTVMRPLKFENIIPAFVLLAGGLGMTIAVSVFIKIVCRILESQKHKVFVMITSGKF